MQISKTKAPSFRFMEKVALEYENLGASVKLETNIIGQNIDVLAVHVLPNGQPVRIAVECKNYHRPVGIREVEKFGGVFRSLRNAGHVDLGCMVSMTGFSQPAQANASANSIHLMTLDHLQDRINSLRIYLQRTVKLSEDGQALNVLGYIPLGAHRLSGMPVSDVAGALLDWLKTDSKQLLLLGEGGAGKTTICRRFSLLAARNFLDGESSRIPIYVDLKLSGQLPSILSVVSSTLSSHGVILPQDVLTRLIRQGKICLILDSFDELEHRNIYGETNCDFRELDALISEKSKLILVCRENFFRSPEHVLSYDLGTERISLAGANKEDPILRIDRLRPSVVESCLNRHTSSKVSSIPSSGRVKKLLVKPLHLRMFVETLGEAPSQPSAPSTRAELYDLYVRKSLSWDARRSSAAIRDAGLRRLIYESLAVECFKSGSLEVSEESARKVLIEKSPSLQASKLPAVISDVLAGCLLQTLGNGRISWGHKTYSEYLVASQVAERVRGNVEYGEIMWFTRDERDFLIEILEAEDLDKVNHWLRRGSNEQKMEASFLLGGFGSAELIDARALAILREYAEADVSPALRINSVITLVFLGEVEYLGGIFEFLRSYLLLEGLPTVPSPYLRVNVPRWTSLLPLQNEVGSDVLTMFICEALEATARVGDRRLLPLLRCMLKAPDKRIIDETRESIRHLGP